MKMCPDIYAGVRTPHKTGRTPHKNMRSDVDFGLGTPHKIQWKKLMWSGVWVGGSILLELARFSAKLRIQDLVQIWLTFS